MAPNAKMKRCLLEAIRKQGYRLPGSAEGVYGERIARGGEGFAKVTLWDALELATQEAEPDTLRRVQDEQRPWVLHNFGQREAWQPLLGIGEEVGELMHAHLKAHQGIRTGEDHEAAKVDALADIIIFACDYASASGVDITDALATTWDQVKQRDWKANAATADPEDPTDET